MLGILGDHILPEKYPAEKEHSRCVKRITIVSKKALRSAIAGKLGLIEDARTTLATTKGYNGVGKTDH